MAVKGFSFYLTYWDVAQELKPREQGEFYRAIMDYMFADLDKEAELPKNVRVCFKAVKANLKTSKGRSDAVSKRYTNDIQNGYKRPTKQIQDKDKDKDKDKGECSSFTAVAPHCPECGAGVTLDIKRRGLMCTRCGWHGESEQAVMA